MRRVFVAGFGATPIREHWTLSLRDLMVEASLKALEDAGAERKQVEAIYVGNMSSGVLQGQEHLGALLATWLGIPGVHACKVEAACASGGVAFHQGYLAVASGVYDHVLVVGVEKMSDAVTRDLSSALIMADDQEYTAFTGATFVALNALVYRRYMERFGVKQEDIAMFAVHDHRYAVNNPLAQFRFEISLDTVMKSPVVADPIRLFECAPTGDGAAAVLLCSEDSPLVKNKDTLVEVVGSSVATDILSLHDRDDLVTLNATVRAARRAFKQAGLSPSDVDVLEVHDAFTVLGVIHLEDLGFAKKGEGWKLLKEGELEVGGKLPTNTMGGLKARGHPVGATGVYEICDVLSQLMGMAGKNQVEGAEVGLAQNVGGVGGTVSVSIFKRVR